MVLAFEGPFAEVAPAAAHASDPLLRLGSQRGNQAVKWIDDKPRRRAFQDLVVVAEFGRTTDQSVGVAAVERRALDRVGPTCLENLRQLVPLDVLEAPAFEVLRAFERRALL